MHTGPSLGSTSQPSLCDPSDRPLCVHVLLSAGRRSSQSGGNEQYFVAPHGPNVRYLFLLVHVDTSAHPAASSHPTPIIYPPFTNPKTRPRPTHFVAAARGVFLPIFRYRPSLLDSSRHPPSLPACLPASLPACSHHPSAASDDHQIKGPAHSRPATWLLRVLQLSSHLVTGHLQPSPTIHSHFCPVLPRPFTFFFASPVPTLLP